MDKHDYKKKDFANKNLYRILTKDYGILIYVNPIGKGE